MTVRESIMSAISAGEAAGAVTTEIRMSVAAAWELAGDLEQMQMTRLQTQADIYGSMKDSRFSFMDRVIVVADA